MFIIYKMDWFLSLFLSVRVDYVMNLQSFGGDMFYLGLRYISAQVDRDQGSNLGPGYNYSIQRTMEKSAEQIWSFKTMVFKKFQTTAGIRRVTPLNLVRIHSFSLCWQAYDQLWPQIIAVPPLSLPAHLDMWSDKSESTQNWQQMRMEVDEEINAQSERKHLKIWLPVSVCVCSFWHVSFWKTQAALLQSRGGRQISGETKLTREGKKRKRGKRKREL